MLDTNLTPAKRLAADPEGQAGLGLADQQDETVTDIGAPPLKKRTKLYGSTYQVTYHEVRGGAAS